MNKFRIHEVEGLQTGVGWTSHSHMKVAIGRVKCIEENVFTYPLTKKIDGAFVTIKASYIRFVLPKVVGQVVR